jgi:hypothetical protein
LQFSRWNLAKFVAMLIIIMWYVICNSDLRHFFKFVFMVFKNKRFILLCRVSFLYQAWHVHFFGTSRQLSFKRRLADPPLQEGPKTFLRGPRPFLTALYVCGEHFPILPCIFPLFQFAVLYYTSHSMRNFCYAI